MDRIKRGRVTLWLALGYLAICRQAAAQKKDDEDQDAGGQPVAATETQPPRRGRERPAAEHPEARPLPKGGPTLPRPDAASGLAVAPAPASSAALAVPRALLLLPRAAFEIVSAPIRGGLWVYDRYDVGRRAVDLFFNDERTFGVYPVAFFETGFGISLGARLVDRDLFGKNERLSAAAMWGGRNRQRYVLRIDSGDRLGPLELGLKGEYEYRPKERFFGIGNLDEVDLDDVVEPVDPFGPEAVSTRYRERGERGGIQAIYEIAPLLHLEAHGLADKRNFGDPSHTDDPPVEDVYDTAELVGFDEGTDAWIGELRLSWDTRRSAGYLAPDAIPGAGWLLTGYGGYNAPITDDWDGFWRYGADAQLFINLYHGTRVLGLRALVDEVRADPEDIPFVYLPALGGDDLLRGYQSERFRDSALTMASAEYTWELNRAMFAFLFVDVGRVQPSLADASLDDLRLGYGGGFQFQTRTTFVMRTHVGSSIDGGIVFNLSFNPAIDARVEEN